MKTIRIALALALLPLCSPAADIAPVVSWTVETNALQPSQRGRKDLEIVRGETVVLECQLLSGGAAINLAEATSVLLRYTPANPATNSTHYVVTGAVHNASTGKVRVRWTPAAAPAADRLQYEIAVGSSTSTVARAWGLLRLLPGVGDDSTGSAVERSTIDWSTVDSQNEGDAPWPVIEAGSGITITSNGTSRIVSSPGSAGDLTGVTSDDGSIVVTSGTGPVPNVALPSVLPARNAALLTDINASSLATGTVAAARLGGGTANATTWLRGDSYFAPLPFATTNDVRAAVAGAYVNLDTGGTITNMDAQIVLTGGSSYIEAASGAFQTGLSVNANPVLTTASTVNAAMLNGESGEYYLDGANITNGTAIAALSASALSTGTIPDSVFPATLPAASGANLTNLDASDLASGTIPDAVFPASLPAIDGSALTGISAGVGGSTGSADNAALRADGAGGSAVQSSSLRIADVTATYRNLALVNTDGSNAMTVIGTAGTGAFVVGPVPTGAAGTGNARGAYAVDLQIDRASATQIAAGQSSFVAGSNCSAISNYSYAIGRGSTANGVSSALGAYTFGYNCNSTSWSTFTFGEACTANSARGMAVGGNATSQHSSSIVIGTWETVSSDRSHQIKMRADEGITHQTDAGSCTMWGKRASAPSSGIAAGDTYYDTSTNKMRCYNGTTWNDLF